ncbi:MAG TPA: sigma-54 dependent transcriptional regulator [Candidatus Saccharimonadaceae bacterium]|nr:sigma-54 dependent transcriptional regulator [Candidatus Saccharimonadaceae bacterium]
MTVRLSDTPGPRESGPPSESRLVGGVTLLVVDDEEAFRRLTCRELARTGYRVQGAESLEEARRLLANQHFHLVVLDMRLPDGSGLELLREIRAASPTTGVVILTAYGTVQEAIRAMKEGAIDFLTKPCKLTELEAVLEKAIERQALERGNTALQRDVERLGQGQHFIGQSSPVRELLNLLSRVAQTDATVLIRGESGVGKELISRAVHRLSARAAQPFVVVDCASLHENLLQSELFGHEKGAYTGAIRLKHGLFEVADRGTIFLDEIGELTPALQVKLLRVLETGTFRRLGGTADIHVDVRMIAATNRALEQMMQNKEFREDLYYRLNVFSLHIPPLRDRPEDIPLLVEHFIRNSSVVPKRGVHCSAPALEVLTRYRWPGNVRELENVIERALILCDAGVIEPEHLPLGVRLEPTMRSTEEDGRLVTLAEVERRYLLRVVDECKGHRQKAASILGISERNLYRKLKEFEGGKPEGEPDEA